MKNLSLEEMKKLHDEDKLKGSFDVSHSDYHAGPGMNSTFLINTMEYSIGHAKYWKENPEDPSKAMLEGTLFHTAILEPALIDKIYMVVPKIDKRRKEWPLLESKASLEGKIIVSKDAVDAAMLAGNAIRNSNTGRDLFKDIQVEQSYFWRDKDTQILCKAKADAINSKYKILIDLKKTADARLWSIKKSVMSYGYKLQASFYQHGINLAMDSQIIDSTVWVFIEPEAPHGIRFVEVKKEWIEEGKMLYMEALFRYKQSMETGNFPLYDDAIISIDEKENVS